VIIEVAPEVSPDRVKQQGHPQPEVAPETREKPIIEVAPEAKPKGPGTNPSELAP
jgi:hypothetical protein